jgi:hypothetical protein
VALNFDNTGNYAPLGAPFTRSSDAVVATSLDLIYDASALTLTFEREAEPSAVPRGAAVEVSQADAQGRHAVLVGLGVGDMLPPPAYHTINPSMGLASASLPLLHPRLGATVTAVRTVNRYLVWGGDLSATPTVLENAGEVLDPDGAAMAISAALMAVPAPTAFHTATRIDDRAAATSEMIVVAGGIPIEVTMGRLFSGRATDTIFTLSVRSDGAVVYRDVGDADYEPTILHTATEVPGLGVVLVGGASVVSGDRLTPVNRVSRVDLTTFGHDVALDDLTEPRFGHTATLLPGGRLLITGGLGPDPASPGDLRALALPELIYLDAPPHTMISASACVDQD